MSKKKKRIILIVLAALLVTAGVLCMIFLPNNRKQMQQKPSVFQEMLKTKEEVVIDCLGDSITWGMYSSPQLHERIEDGEIETGLDDGGQLFEDAGIYISAAFQSDPSYPEVLEQELNRMLKQQGGSTTVKTVNDGICGDWITPDTYQRISCEPDLVLLLMGGNNYYFGYPIEGMLEANIKAFAEKEIPVILVNYPLFPGETHEADFRRANEQMEKVSEELSIPLIDVSSRMDSLVFTGTGEVPEGMYLRDELFSPDRIHLSEKGYELLGRFVAEALFETDFINSK